MLAAILISYTQLQECACKYWFQSEINELATAVMDESVRRKSNHCGGVVVVERWRSYTT